MSGHSNDNSVSENSEDITARMAELALSPLPSKLTTEHVVPWVLWVYNPTADTPQHSNCIFGFQQIAQAFTVNQLELLLQKNSVGNLPPGSGNGYHFLKKGIIPLRMDNLLGAGYTYITVTKSNLSEKRISNLWKALVTNLMFTWSFSYQLFENQLSHGWITLMPYINGVGIERLSNNRFLINVWTCVESSQGVYDDVRHVIGFLMTEMSNEILMSESFHNWVQRPHLLPK